METVQPEFMVFLSEGHEGIGAVRETRRDTIVVDVENAGEFVVPRSAITAVHDNKVIVSRAALPAKMLDAIGRRHDREDPDVAG